MKKGDFIELILKKKTIDKEIFQLSLKIEDYPVAREILKKIENNYNFNNLIKSRNLIKIRSASADLKAQLPSIIKDSFLRKEINKFINDITDRKIIGINEVNKNDLSKEQNPPGPVRKQQSKNTNIKNINFDPEILKDQEIKILKQKIIKKEEHLKEWDDAFSGVLIIGTILAPIIFIAGCYFGVRRE